jgi:hypothetical protein
LLPDIAVRQFSWLEKDQALAWIKMDAFDV